MLDWLLKEAKVEPYQQLTKWTCSAACLRAVLLHYGQDVSEEELVQVIGARPNRGAEVTEIAEAARKLGYDSFDFAFESLEQAKVVLEQDMPIICDFQSFNHPGKGHYVVLTKIDEQGAHLMDPNTSGNYRLLTLDHVDARWWDRTMAAPHDLVIRWGVVVLPPEAR